MVHVEQNSIPHIANGNGLAVMKHSATASGHSLAQFQRQDGAVPALPESDSVFRRGQAHEDFIPQYPTRTGHGQSDVFDKHVPQRLADFVVNVVQAVALIYALMDLWHEGNHSSVSLLIGICFLRARMYSVLRG
jgi:hypothetical protein